MLDTRPVRALALVVPAAQWQAVGATHQFPDDFIGLGQFLPEQ